MKYFDVRFTGGGTIGDWPVEAPALRVLPPPPRLFIPYSGPSQPVADMKCYAGDPLAQIVPGSPDVALAPLAGRVIGAGYATLMSGQRVAAIEFEPDQTVRASSPPEPSQHPPSLDDIGPADLPAWIDRLRGAGICADRHGCPDLIGQLQQAGERPVDTVVCSLLDGDPTLHLNSLLGVRNGVEVCAGAALIGKLLSAKNVWLAMDHGAPRRWIAPVRRRGRKLRARTMRLANDYPVSDPTLLIYTMLGRRLVPGRLPTELGVMLIDAAAACAIGHLLIHRRPMFQVPMALFDHAGQTTHFVLAWVGTPLRDVLEALGIEADQVTLRAGNLLRDMRVSADAVVAGGATTLHITPMQPAMPPDPCVRCGWCMEGCPTRIYPVGLLEAAQRNDPALAREFGLDACIECGICSFVCPSRLPLLEGIRRLKR